MELFPCLDVGERDLLEPGDVLVSGAVAVHADLEHIDERIVLHGWLERRGDRANHEDVLIVDCEDLLPQFDSSLLIRFRDQLVVEVH